MGKYFFQQIICFLQYSMISILPSYGKDNRSLRNISIILQKFDWKAATRAFGYCLYINYLSQFAREIQIFGGIRICFKNLLSLIRRILTKRIPIAYNISKCLLWNCDNFALTNYALKVLSCWAWDLSTSGFRAFDRYT